MTLRSHSHPPRPPPDRACCLPRLFTQDRATRSDAIDERYSMSRHCTTLILGFVLVAWLQTPAAAAERSDHYAFWAGLAEVARAEADHRLDHRNAGRKDGLVLTNAGYAEISGSSTAPCLDTLHGWRGALPGKATLLDVHSAQSSSLWFFFYEMTSGNGIFLEVNATAVTRLMSSSAGKSPKTVLTELRKMPAKDLFSRIASENVKAENILANPGAWNEKVTQKVFGGREFSIVTIANATPHGAPHGLVRSMLFHDHYCPGVTSGYLLVNYLEKHFPLQAASDKYFVFSVPPWCKDDALLTLLNTTPGKSGYAVSYLNDAAKATLKDEYKDIAGIFFRLNSSTNQWEARVLSFSFQDVQKLSGMDAKQGFPWEYRLKLDLWLLGQLDKPEQFIKPLKEITLASGEAPGGLASPGSNILSRFDMVKPQ
jgi:formylmethanofuran dehydrogenase subunit E-like metal-binding protein